MVKLNFIGMLLAFQVCLFSLASYCQTPPPGGFGGIRGIDPPKEEPLTSSQLKQVYNEVTKSVQALKAQGKLSTPISQADTVRFGWPLRQASGYTDPGYYGISNFIDWNPLANQVGDYNCGNRTYDGHRGTDIYTSPFPWHKKDENAVEVIAAAPGTIVYKQGNSPDTSCANCNPNLPTCLWNAIYVQSDVDGSIVWYGHLKKNSLTAKQVGDHVNEGEFLAVLGSSGNSTGPHLHFEVWKDGNYNWLYEPWAGPCNQDGNSSFWKNQQSYYMPGMDKVMTASKLPVFSQCYMDGKVEQTNSKNSFTFNDMVYLVAFGRDNLAGKQYSLKVLKPNGEALWDWKTNSFGTFYSSFWFYYFYPGTNFNIAGTWKFIATYEGKTAETSFEMVNPLPLNLLSFTGSFDGKSAVLAWQTTDEQKFDRFGIERSTDGTHFEAIGSVKSKGNSSITAVNKYGFNDVLPPSGTNLYRLKLYDKDGQFSYSNIVDVKVQMQPTALRILSNPVVSELRFVCDEDYKNASIKVLDHTGRTVGLHNTNIRRNQQVSLQTGYVATGTYFLVVEGNGKRISRIFIKQ